MKISVKFLGFIALVAVIMFTMTVCDEGGNEDPTLTGTVTILGTARVGETLTVDTSGLNVAFNATKKYQWKIYANVIGTSSSYLVTAEDIGYSISVTVTVDGYSGSVTSGLTSSVSDLPVLSGTVTITGNAIVGNELTANTVSLSGSGTITYQWKRGDTTSTMNAPIGTDSSTYELTADDLGKYIAVTVTRAGHSGSVTSTATLPVINNLSWTQSTNAIVGTGTINDIAFNGTNLWVVVASGGIVARSTDNGTYWTRTDLGSTGDLMGGKIIFVNNSSQSQNINAIAYGNGRWIAVGNYGKMATSTDVTVATSWTEITGTPFGTTNVNTILYAEGLWIAGGMNGLLKKSTDGTTWTNMTNDPFGYNAIRSIAYGNGRWVAVGANGSMYTSTDGSFWTSVDVTSLFTYTLGGTSTVQTIETVAYANNLWIAAGGGGLMATSTNGTTWTSVTGSPFRTSSITSVTYGNNKWVAAVGSGYGTATSIAISIDGKNWVLTPNTIFDTDQINGIAVGNNRWVAVGANSKVAYADDN
jgi:photosystem II stability/assembly factor-like uncharacterized protein